HGGVTGVGEVVHRPGPDLAASDTRVQCAGHIIGYRCLTHRLRGRRRLLGRAGSWWFRGRHRPSAALPARSLSTCSEDFTPDTPTAPTIWPSATTGTPPSSMPSSCGADRKATRPLLMISS